MSKGRSLGPKTGPLARTAEVTALESGRRWHRSATSKPCSSQCVSTAVCHFCSASASFLGLLPHKASWPQWGTAQLHGATWRNNSSFLMREEVCVRSFTSGLWCALWFCTGHAKPWGPGKRSWGSLIWANTKSPCLQTYSQVHHRSSQALSHFQLGFLLHTAKCAPYRILNFVSLYQTSSSSLPGGYRLAKPFSL